MASGRGRSPPWGAKPPRFHPVRGCARAVTSDGMISVCAGAPLFVQVRGVPQYAPLVLRGRRAPPRGPRRPRKTRSSSWRQEIAVPGKPVGVNRHDRLARNCKVSFKTPPTDVIIVPLCRRRDVAREDKFRVVCCTQKSLPITTRTTLDQSLSDGRTHARKRP